MATSDRTIRVALIEGHTLVREGLKRILRDEVDLAVVGEAGDGDAGVRLAERLAATNGSSVDVAVADLLQPGLGGVLLLQRLRDAHPDLRILSIGTDHEDAQVRTLLDAGANGYLLKRASVAELAEAIRAVARGELVLSSAVAGRVFAEARHAERGGAGVEQLTARERELLALLATGLTSKAIALQLGLRPKTVENYRGRILGKLGAANTVAAIGLAVKRGLLPSRSA